MNRTKNTIGWCDLSWNPVTGCLHGCWYCYARKLFTRFHKPFTPLFYPERLKEPWQLRKPSKIFVCSVADLFAPWTPTEWRDAVLQSTFECPVKHTFQLLTKNPENIPKQIMFPDNWWFGTTVTGENNDVKNIDEIKKVHAKVRFVSFEPLLGKIEPDLKGIQWIIIGKLTGSKRVKLQDEWVDTIFKEARRLNIPVFMKNNLIPDYHGLYWMQEFPK